MTPLGGRLDNYAYDGMFRIYRPRPWAMESMLLAIDEQTLMRARGMRAIRGPLAEALELVAAAGPKARAPGIRDFVLVAQAIGFSTPMAPSCAVICMCARAFHELAGSRRQRLPRRLRN